MDSLNPQIPPNLTNSVNPALTRLPESQRGGLETISTRRRGDIIIGEQRRNVLIGKHRNGYILLYKKLQNSPDRIFEEAKQIDGNKKELENVKSSFSKELKNGRRITLFSTLHVLAASARLAPRRVQELGSRVLNAVRSEKKKEEIREQSKKLRQNDLGW